MKTRTMQNPEHAAELETIQAGSDLMNKWFDYYNLNLPVGPLVHWPAVSFGGARLRKENLALRIREEADPGEGWAEGSGPGHRDEGWGYSLIDKMEILQPTAVKGHVLINFRRLTKDGKTYGIGLNRLAAYTKNNGKWRFRVVSSCGLRDPKKVYDEMDAPIMAEVRQVIEESIAAYNLRDVEALRSLSHFPFIRLDREEFRIIREPGDFHVDFAEVQRQTGWEHSTVRYLDVLVPQAHDKVVVDLTVCRYDANGEELDPEGSVYIVTKQNGRWGLQFSSTRYAIGGLL